MSADERVGLSFFWHDYETFGLDTRRDYPSQFAGIRTNEELEPIGDPVNLLCRPPRDALPDPQSCLITGITPQQCEAAGLREAEFARRIHAELSAPHTIGVGYNTLKFDDGVTRHLFWRNLLDVYGREYENGCGRWDLLKVVRAVYAFRPEALQWPKNEQGRDSMKLERLSAHNGLSYDQAHDALSDVQATIGLARLIRNKVRPLWDHCLKLRSKLAVQEILGAPLGAQEPVLHVSGMYPQERGHMALVIPLGAHPVNRNEVIVWDLSADPVELLDLDVDAIRLRLFTREADLPAGVSRLPIKTLRINETPIVVPLKRLSAERAQSLGLNLSEQLQRAVAVQAHRDAFAGIDWRTVYVREYPEESLDAEQTLYGGAFLGGADKRRLASMPALDGQALARWQPSFEDARLDDLLLRYRARNWPESLNPQEQEQWLEHCRARLLKGKGGHRTVAAVLARIDELAEERLAADDERAQMILEAVVDWVEAIVP